MLFLHGGDVIHHGHHRHSGNINGVKYLLQPVFHGSAVADQDVCILDSAHICRGRLEGMTVHPGRDHQSQINIITCDLTRKIIVGKQGRHDVQPPARLLLLSAGIWRGTGS